MRRSSSFVSFLTLQKVLIISCILLPVLTESSRLMKDSDGDLVDQICKKTPFYDLCSSILHANPLTLNTDPKGMALIMVNDVLANATDTLSYIQQLIKQTSDEKLEQQLAFCAESYIPVVKYILPQAADAINQGRYGFASYCIIDAEKEVDACNKKFTGTMKSPLGDRNGIMQKLVDVAAAIVKLLSNR